MQKVADIFAAWPCEAELGRGIGVPHPTLCACQQRRSIPAADGWQIITAAAPGGYPEITAELLARVHARNLSDTRGFAREGQPTCRKLRKHRQTAQTGPQAISPAGSACVGQRKSPHISVRCRNQGPGDDRRRARRLSRPTSLWACSRFTPPRRCPLRAAMLAVNPFTLDDILGSKPS